MERELDRYINLKLAALGAPALQATSDPAFMELAGPLLRNFHQKDQLLGYQLCPVDSRIQQYLDAALHDVCPQGVPQLPGRTFGVRGVAQIMSYLQNWATSYNAWVTMIDEKRGPNIGPFPAGDTIIKRNSQDNSLEYRCDYYFYGQLMKFVQRGAVRIASTVSEGPVHSIAFMNPDGRIVLVAVNTGKAAAVTRVWHGGQSFRASLPGASVATYVWMKSAL